MKTMIEFDLLKDSDKEYLNRCLRATDMDNALKEIMASKADLIANGKNDDTTVNNIFNRIGLAIDKHNLDLK